MTGPSASREGPPGPRKRSIALVIRRPDDPQRWLLVRRPPDDEDLPGVWGLPAGSHRGGETDPDLVVRIGREKLGVRLEPADPLAGGSTSRPGYELEMRLFEARIVEGRPRVPQEVAGVTQYDALEWGRPERLDPGARAGSLCCALGLSVAGSSRAAGGSRERETG